MASAWLCVSVAPASWKRLPSSGCLMTALWATSSSASYGATCSPAPLFHSHLETLQLLGAAQLPEQVSFPESNGRGDLWGLSPTDDDTEAQGGRAPSDSAKG